MKYLKEPLFGTNQDFVEWPQDFVWMSLGSNTSATTSHYHSATHWFGKCEMWNVWWWIVYHVEWEWL